MSFVLHTFCKAIRLRTRFCVCNNAKSTFHFAKILEFIKLKNENTYTAFHRLLLSAGILSQRGNHYKITVYVKNMCIMTGVCLTENAADKVNAHLRPIFGCLYSCVATSLAIYDIFNIQDINLSHRMYKVTL